MLNDTKKLASTVATKIESSKKTEVMINKKHSVRVDMVLKNWMYQKSRS